MPHDISLLTNISVALVAAFAGGLIARRLGLPTIVGYLIAGMAIGPFTPGFVGDISDISQLAEIGVIFLLFALGLEFSEDGVGRCVSPRCGCMFVTCKLIPAARL